MKKILILLFIAIFSSGSILAGTQWASRPFIANGESFPANIDPGVAVDFPGTQSNHNVYETLYQYEYGTLNLRPILATDMSISDDGTVYTFKLREDVKFHDGSDFDAEDVKFTYERIKEKNFGMNNFLGGTLSHVEIDGPYDVRIILQARDANFIGLLPMVRIVPNTIMEHEVDGDMGNAYLSENMVGTGPYKVSKLARPDAIHYTAFEDYWGGWEGSHFKDFIFRFGVDFTSGMLQLEEGSVDYFPDVPSDEIDRLVAKPSVNITFGAVPRSMYFSMNTKAGPLEDVNVRNAINLAFSYEAMPLIFPNNAYTMSGCLPNNLSDVSYPYEQRKSDKEAAKKLLADNGYTPGDIKISLGIVAGFGLEVLAAAMLQEDLAAIGIDLEIVPVTWAVLSTSMTSQDTMWDMGALIINAKTPYSGNYLHQLGHSSAAGGNWNWSYYDNPEFDNLLTEASQSTDPAVRDDRNTKATKYLIDDAVHLCLYGTQNIIGTNAAVKGYVFPTFTWSRVFDVYSYSLTE